MIATGDAATGVPGTSIGALPTPALLLDLDVLEANLRRMSDRCRELDVSLRPHVKTHKCLEIAARQAQLGCRGLTVSTLAEAEVFLQHGFVDITWAFPIILSRLDETARLGRLGRLGVTVDSATSVAALRSLGEPFRVWVKVDCGYGRAGVDPADPSSLELVEEIERSPRLVFAGTLTHSGHAYAAGSPEEIREIAERERGLMTDFATRLGRRRIRVPEVSVGSTPGMSQVTTLEGVTEARPGNYAFYDYTQTRLGSCGLGDCAVTVLSSVVSCRPGEHAVVDAGALSLSKDLGPDDPSHFGRLYTDLAATELDPVARVVSVSQEHGIVNRTLEVGSLVRILPNHSCLTSALFDAYQVVREGEVVDRWKVWRNH